MKTTDFSKNLTDFLSLYLPGERGLSSNTISAYKDTFILFLTFMKKQYGIDAEKLTLSLITQESVITFLEWLQKDRKSSNSTRNARLAALHSFFRYLQYQNPTNLYECQRILAIRSKKTEKPMIAYLTLDGIRLLLAQPDQSNPKGKRDLALLSLMYDSGARVQEIIDLMPSSINFNKPATVRLWGKGNKGRVVPLMDSQAAILHSYMLNNRLLDPYASKYPLFSNGRAEKFTRMGITLILKKYADLATVADPSLFDLKVTPHILRHSKAMHLLQAGVNLVYIRDFLGHSSISTTEIYARADSKQKREALEKVYVDIGQKINTDYPWPKGEEGIMEWLKRNNKNA